MEFNEVLQSRRSCRAFAADPVGEEEVEKLILACQWAPSPLNLQPWEFIVITSPEAKAQVRRTAEEARRAVLDADGPGWVKKYQMDFVEQAPVLIVVLFNPAKGGLGGFFNNPHSALQGASAGVQNLMLAASEMGYGTLWLTFFDPDKLKAALNVPQHLGVAGVIPVGRPSEAPPAPPRKPPKVFRDSYGADA